MTVRILVADDHAVVREGFAALLAAQPDFEVVGQAEDGFSAERLAIELRPDVVLMDIRMPCQDGVTATWQLLRETPDTRVLILTTFDLDAYVYDALRAGASGFLLKDSTAGQVVDGVRVVAAGDALLAPSVTRRLIAEFAARPVAAEPDRLTELTARESEVFVLVARGLSNAEIAAALTVTEHTVKTHVSRLLGKLGLRDRAQAVAVAYESGLVSPRADRSLPRMTPKSRPRSDDRCGHDA
ncbi:response regulator transcription factor [Amycolatopsis anabasis]|uniref:response regulator transcription factor n=1 Tax=Amycolatopsis anabasis TaxID=1840409 RepID=UPI00131CE6F7|nr:response regulator transcription factor [Amycolatopsis anabasis]